MPYSVGTKPSKGSVTINATTGAFTYTPTVAARQNAAKAWLVISSSSTTSRFAPTSEVQNWVDLYIPG